MHACCQDGLNDNQRLKQNVLRTFCSQMDGGFGRTKWVW